MTDRRKARRQREGKCEVCGLKTKFFEYAATYEDWVSKEYHNEGTVAGTRAGKGFCKNDNSTMP